MWGDQESILFEAFYDRDILCGVSARIDLRNIRRRELIQFCECVYSLSCHIYVMETQGLVSPLLEELLPHIQKSRAAEFYKNPKEFLESLSE